MIFIRIWNYFRGYVIIRIEGLYLENFINFVISKGIYLWDIRRLDYTILEAKVGINSLKDLMLLKNNISYQINIKEKFGFPFLIKRLKFRKFFILGFFISVLTMFYLTSFIWSIDISGDENISYNEVINNLKKIGVSIGTYKNKVDTDEIKRIILKEIEDISYVKAKIKGTKLLIDLKARDKITYKVESHYPCNIVSKKRAVIEKVIAKNGKSLVEKGDIVKQGQVLITGIIEDERFDKPLLVHSDGIVLGKTVYKKVIEDFINITIKKETGANYKSREIRIGNKKISLTNTDIPFENYIEDVKIIDKFGITIVTHEYKEVKLVKYKQDINKVKRTNTLKGIEILINTLNKNAKVLRKEIKHTINGNKIITEITLEVLEEIGVKQKIYNKED